MPESKVKKGKEHCTPGADRKGVVPNMSKHPFSLIVTLFWRWSTLVSPIHQEISRAGLVASAKHHPYPFTSLPQGSSGGGPHLVSPIHQEITGEGLVTSVKHHPPLPFTSLPWGSSGGGPHLLSPIHQEISRAGLVASTKHHPYPFTSLPGGSSGDGPSWSPWSIRRSGQVWSLALDATHTPSPPYREALLEMVHPCLPDQPGDLGGRPGRQWQTPPPTASPSYREALLEVVHPGLPDPPGDLWGMSGRQCLTPLIPLHFLTLVSLIH